MTIDDMADAERAAGADAAPDAREEGQRIAELEEQHRPLQQGATQYIISQRHIVFSFSLLHWRQGKAVPHCCVKYGTVPAFKCRPCCWPRVASQPHASDSSRVLLITFALPIRLTYLQKQSLLLCMQLVQPVGEVHQLQGPCDHGGQP